ncbi:MAG: tetratricopeptide repeat protein [Planctomycetaceae bacterium]
MSSSKKTQKLSPAEFLQLVVTVAESGRYEEALRIAADAVEQSPDLRNVRGVCLMRMGRAREAVQLYRSYILAPNCTWMRTDLPVIHRTNFATALMLAGLTLGGRDSLSEIREVDHPSVVRLKQSLAEWQRKLAWWQRIWFRMGIAPEIPVEIRFIPGDLVDVATSISPVDGSSRLPGPPTGAVTLRQTI